MCTVHAGIKECLLLLSCMGLDNMQLLIAIGAHSTSYTCLRVYIYCYIVLPRACRYNYVFPRGVHRTALGSKYPIHPWYIHGTTKGFIRLWYNYYMYSVCPNFKNSSHAYNMTVVHNCLLQTNITCMVERNCSVLHGESIMVHGKIRCAKQQHAGKLCIRYYYTCMRKKDIMILQFIALQCRSKEAPKYMVQFTKENKCSLWQYNYSSIQTMKKINLSH